MPDYEIARPKPAALIESLRSIGYNLPTTIADIVDNSITAGARQVNVNCYWAGANSWIAICDNGDGMSEERAYYVREAEPNPASSLLGKQSSRTFILFKSQETWDHIRDID